MVRWDVLIEPHEVQVVVVGAQLIYCGPVVILLHGHLEKRHRF